MEAGSDWNVGSFTRNSVGNYTIAFAYGPGGLLGMVPVVSIMSQSPGYTIIAFMDFSGVARVQVRVYNASDAAADTAFALLVYGGG